VLGNINGQPVSMIQRVWSQIRHVQLAESTTIVTCKAQVDMIYNQLHSNVPIVVEPSRRDTFPAIALVAAYLNSQVGVDRDETVVVLPVDPYVEDRFFEKLHELEEVLASSGADLALMGVRPTIASEKYGYIVPEPSSADADPCKFLRVRQFREKPTLPQADQLLQQGALWNCGVFAFKLGYVISLLVRKGYSSQYEQLYSQYDQLPKISFDYEVVENAKNVVVLPYNGEWKDLGTWNTLTEEMSTNVLGKGVMSRDSHNSHLINELDIPVVILGLSNVVVAASPDGIIVTDKAASPRVKEVVDFDQRPMYEERRWGWYKVLDYATTDQGNEVLTRKIGIRSGRNLSYQLHYKRSEIWTIVQGHGEVVLDGQFRLVQAGDTVTISAGVKHSILAHSDMEIIEVQTGTELIEEDVVRYPLSWGEIIEASSSKGVNG
jgi:mannose-1-phosphate guanylyltransferase